MWHPDTLEELPYDIPQFFKWVAEMTKARRPRRDPTLTGGCLCGAVRYEIEGKLRHITHCHCGMCRRAHGAAFATYASLARRRFRLKSGESALRAFRSSESVTREFCGTCGSSLFWSDGEHPEAIGIALGSLDGDPGGRPEAHIYAKDRAPWDEITDTLPRFDGDVPAGADVYGES